MRYFFFSIIFLLNAFVLMLSLHAGIFTYYPVSVFLSPVAPPVTFAGSGTYPTFIGSANTSAVVEVVANKALHVYDYDVGGRVVVLRTVTQSLTSGGIFSIQWVAFVTNYTDPSGVGVILQEIQVNIGGSPYYVSIYYYGGNQVYFQGPGPTTYVYPVDMSVAHVLNITVSRPAANRLRISYYVDNSLAYTYDYSIPRRAAVTVYSVEGGRYDTRNAYDLYVDDVRMRSVTGVITSEDFEDGVDDFFVNSYSSGNAGKVVVYYTFPKIFLLARNNDTKTYACKLIISPLTAPVTASFYVRNSTYTSTSIKIKNSVIVGETSEVLLGGGSYTYMYLNITAPLTASLPITFNLQFVYRVYDSDGVTVYYPITVKFG